MKKYNGNLPESYLQTMGRKAGVGMHITSLPGEHGIGDIADCARSFIDDLVGMNLGVWQILPTGPTAYGDSPYQPLSAFAGNAMMIGLDPLVRDGLLLASELETLESLPREYVDYGRLIPAKRALLEHAVQRLKSRPGNGLRSGYEDFLHRFDERWLDDYAMFRVLKSLHGERAWPEWETIFVHRDRAALNQIKNNYHAAIENFKFTQFLFEHQWQELRAYATQKGICLFGDMPIYIALDSSDAWAHPERLLIDQDGHPLNIAGVPPDYFSEDGQLWGNPLYDWSYHERTGYRWWIERIQHAASQTGLVRIDHFRGFESFWSVPYGDETARDGKWEPGPGDALFAAMREAMETLPIVAEDLGVITPQVDQLRLNHGIPGMVVLQFEVGDPDFDIDSIEENSVCYTGTHDNDTTLGWFMGNGADTRSAGEIASNQAGALRCTGGAPQTITNDMIRLAFSSRASLAIAPMQDYLGLGSEARLNVPGTTLNNWRWRLLAGQLTQEHMDSVHQMVQQARR
jgi:4-alpha-glucanotransferase